jgi:hypothetical protein
MQELARPVRHASTRVRALAPAHVLALAVAAACAQPNGAPGDSEAISADADSQRAAEAMAAAFDREAQRFREQADSFDAIMHPLPLLRPAEEAALRRYANAAQLQRARELGITPDQAEAALQRLVAEGRLVTVEESSHWWIVRELDYSVALMTPDAYRLLRLIGERFQARLDELGLPPYRYELTSILRSAEDQARLRAVNPNAAAGESTHQYATTFDIAYNAFAPPAEPVLAPSAPEARWLEPRLEWIGALMLETIAARRARELQAILGQVLIELQNEGLVMVTLERLQPVYHMTVARRITG